MKIVVGSRSLWPTPNLAQAVFRVMIGTDQPILVRSDYFHKVTSPTEDIAVRIGSRLNRPVTPWAPGGRTRSSVYLRDVHMVDSADEVFAFFAPGRLMEGGTGHVAAVGLRRGIAVHAFELDDEGEVVEIASDEGDLVRIFDAYARSEGE